MLLESLEERIQQKAKFFSDITGLAVTEQRLSIPKEADFDFMPLEYWLVLGNAGEQYIINFETKSFIDNCGKQSGVKWDVSYNGATISKYHMFHSDTNSGDGEAKNARLKELLHSLGGVDAETAFMDFETYTVKSLNSSNHDDYFRNIYLIVMAHMKERGLQMPPILSKNPDISDAMNSGAVEDVKSLLESIISDGHYEPRCMVHMRAEAEEITGYANHIRQRRDPHLDLFEKFTNITAEKVPGQKILPPYNILVVENNPPYGAFTSILAGQLAKDGRYGGTSLITEFMIACCMELCETGQIDMVVFDWSTPSDGEALMFRGQKNPLFDMFYGNNQAAINFDNGSFQASRQDGQVFDWDALREEAERLDIRQRWMNMIGTKCASAGVAAPPYHIVRSEEEFPNLARLVSEKLGNSINH